jgi:hypothetical protein
MAEIRHLNPHDPTPEGGHAVVVLRRFDEDDPHKIVVELTLTHRHGLPERTHLRHANGTPMTLEEAASAASAVADEAGIPTVQVIDRTAGPRERDIQQHGGDHSVHMERLDDDDLEEGERGPDMRRT